MKAEAVDDPFASQPPLSCDDKLEIIFRILPYMFVRIDLQGTIMEFRANPNIHLRFTPEELVGSNFRMVFKADLVSQLEVGLADLLAGKSTGRMEFSAATLDGLRHFEASGLQLTDREEVALIIRDITERKRMELELQKNEERYRLISNVTSDYMYSTTLDDHGNLVLNWVAGAFEQITGYTFEEYVAAGGWRARVYPEDVEVDRYDIERLSQNKPIVSDIRTIAKDGRIIWVRSYAQPVWDEQLNRLKGIFGAVQDITTEKVAEEALRESEARYRFLFEQNPAPMLIYDRATLSLLDVNEAFFRHYGYAREDAQAMNLLDLYPPDEKGPIKNLVPLLQGYQNVGEWHHYKKDGTLITIMACSHDLTYEGKAARVAVLTDVTERKHAEDRVREMNVELEHRVQQRTAQLQSMNEELESFSYSVSHDLRTPLRGMSGYAHFLKEDYAHLLPAEGLEFLNNIETSARLMDNLITGMLKMSRLGRQPCEKHEVLPARVAAEAWASLREETNGRLVKFQIGDLPNCQADPVLLKQVYVNLLSNALKFSRDVPEPVISVGADREDSRTVYWVKDNGVGFDMQFAQNIFEPFMRLPGQEQVEGHGIGLSIVQRIILKHGGEIWAEGQPGRGATFYFTIPDD